MPWRSRVSARARCRQITAGRWTRPLKSWTSAVPRQAATAWVAAAGHALRQSTVTLPGSAPPRPNSRQSFADRRPRARRKTGTSCTCERAATRASQPVARADSQVQRDSECRGPESLIPRKEKWTQLCRPVAAGRAVMLRARQTAAARERCSVQIETPAARRRSHTMQLCRSRVQDYWRLLRLQLFAPKLRDSSQASNSPRAEMSCWLPTGLDKQRRKEEQQPWREIKPRISTDNLGISLIL